MNVCKNVRYSGRVQGVGFRYTCQRLAERFPIAGHVRNLPSGEVELQAEGEAADVAAFLEAVARQMASCIDGQAVRDLAPAGIKGFTIRH
jgi:acylphosphatase